MLFYSLFVARYCAALSPTGIVSAVIPQNQTVIGDKVTLVCRSQVGPEYNKTLYCAYDSLTDNMTLQGDSPNCPGKHHFMNNRCRHHAVNNEYSKHASSYL